MAGDAAPGRPRPRLCARFRVSLDARSRRAAAERGAAWRFLRAVGPETRFKLRTGRLSFSRGISIIRCRPTRPASQHWHAQSHNCPGVPDFEDFSRALFSYNPPRNIDELKVIGENLSRVYM